MAEAILTGAAANVLASLESYAIQHIGLPFGVKRKLRKMETNISTIKNVLLDAQEQQMSNRAVKEWLERLKLILYDAEDLLDEVATETKRRQVETHNSLMRKVQQFFTSSNSLVFRYAVGWKIRDIGKRLDEIVLQMNGFKFVVKLVERPIQINRREETSSFVNTLTIIGRDADKEKLVRLLLSSGDEENVAIIPIVGMGGMGKTTLAQLVYNDDRIQKYFTQRMWVSISNDFDVTRILIKLLQAGETNWDSNEGLEQLQNRVRNLLRGHKFLLFLDDVWNEDRVEWKKLEDVLITQAKGSRIVVTTRSKMVASIVRTNTVEPYVLRGLSNNECLDILVKWAFKEGDESKHPNLVNIAEKIVEKCGGVPLAARTLGAFLFSKTNERDWLLVRDNEMWAIVQKENDILPILRLSYDQMPSYLKHCFAYCSLFEKDEIIYGTRLIHAWMALGFVQCVQTEDELEDIGEGYLLELVRRSFLERDCTRVHYDPVEREAYKMHDLVHDLAQYVAGNEFLTIKGSITKAIPETVRHVSSFDLNTDCSFPTPLLEAKKLRTIVYPIKKQCTFMSPGEPAIASFRSLRVLQGGLGLPDDIGKLKLLRYISTTTPDYLPNSFCMLLNLQYLDLIGSYVSGLPEDFCKLISLRFLALTTKSTRLPKEGIGRLISLRTLFFCWCGNLESLGEGIEHLPCLRKLALLSCSKLVSLPAGFRHLKRLEIEYCESLNLSDDDALKGLISLKELELRHLPRLVNLPKGLLDTAATLTHLYIDYCQNFTSPSESVLPNLLSLQSLLIVGCDKVASLPEGMQRLTKLQYLRIGGCSLNTSRYREGGEDWPKIAHVPKIRFG